MSEEEVIEKPEEEEKLAPRAAKPVKKMPKVRPGTVKGKIAAIKKAVAMIDSGARAIQAKISKQMKENQRAIAAFHAGVTAQMKENQEAVAAMQSGIREQMDENKAYVKDFYG